MSETMPFHIILVEDDDDHAELALFQIERFAPDAQVQRITTGPGAVEHLAACAESREPAPDLVLLDLKLPELDGLGVLQEVRAFESLASVPIIVLSTSDAERDKTQAYAQHANGYVVKPSSFEGYRSLFEGLLGYWQKHNRRPRRLP